MRAIVIITAETQGDNTGKYHWTLAELLFEKKRVIPNSTFFASTEPVAYNG